MKQQRKRKKRISGQRQRVWIAIALCQGTKTLFLDEPITYLDIRYQIEILQLYGIELGVTRGDGQKFVLAV